jgi:gliding motility-associated-like protein
MFNHHILKFASFILINFFGILVSAQLSKTHYIPPLTDSGTNSSAPQDHYIYISTPKAASISFTIKPVGLGTAGYITGTVSNATPYVYNIGNGRDTQLFVNVNETSTVKSNKGYIIEAQDVIYVSIRINAGSQAGALVSKGQAALGTTFRVGSYTNENPQSNYLNFVSVMATEDNTQVSFSNLPAGLIIENYSGATPVNITLNKGESYTLATNSDNAVVNQDGLIGCLVTSNKSIVVNCGSANGSFHNGGARDYGIDQIVDLSKVGTEYIFVKGDGQNGWENVLIVAHTDNTTISINGGGTAATINAGDYYLIEGNQYSSSGNMYVQTSQPVFAYQGVGATNSEANQGMFFVPPLSCETRGNLDNIANIESIGNTTYTGGISIVTKVGATVTINNLPVSNFSTVGPNSVTGKTDYVTYKVTGLNGNVSVQSTDELYCAYFNFNGAATSGSFYSGFPTAPEINFDTVFTTLGICIPNVTLEVANMGNFDSIEWYFDDGSGSGFIATGVTTLQYIPTVSGNYKLIGQLLCSGLTLESIEVPVSICPDDIDNDGIPDNVDIDNDNDGILNCTESYGNQDINASNPTSGSIPVGSYTYTGNINTIGGAAASPLIGANDGTFMSETPSRNNTPETSVTYDLVFNNTLNLLFEYATSTALGSGLLTNDEEFIIRVPNTRTITLLDPDDQLLVDTNFDGVYEAGITQISSFEIRFKLKNASLTIGSGTFSFSANSVDAITYIHKNTSDTNSNQATFKLTATCVAKDTDIDGIEDSLDLDSDNDGIPDFIENTGTLTPLSGIDADLNGLDDIYDITATPIDTDNDTVFDFYDLDSDNDGIYDVFESGSNLLDIDFDGIIDNINATIGTNGWDDNAESSPDSNIIGFTVSDFDGDTIFNYLDLDSDGDTCSDVIEAGFSDVNGDDILGDNIATTNGLGLVTNASDGYTIPNSDYLTAAPISITTQPTDTEVCELSDTTISVVSTPVDSVQWEVSTDGINWTNIVDGANYNGSQTNDLTIMATPLTFNGYQYRAFLNVAGNSCGLYTDEIDFTVISLPVANTAPVMRQCDDDNNGTMPFDLTLQNNAINTIAGMTISYHASQADADTGNAPLASPYESGNTTIYARVVNDLNTNCNDTSNFDLEVYESPIPLNAPNVTPIQECDNTSVGTDTDGFIIFDLTQRETEILNGQSATDFALSYFTDSAHANQIPNPVAYTNATPNNQTIYVRMTNNFYNTCFADTSFEIDVYELPQVTNPNTYQQCDDASNDGQAFFNLELDNIKEEINPNYIAEGLTFTFYETQTDAETNGTTIPNPSNYQDALGFTPETVWVRAENPNGCFRVAPLTLEVSPSSAALSSYNPNSIYQCDDGTDVRDGVSTFDMTNIKNHISTTVFSTFNVTVHFYESQMDAELEINEILDPSNHQNTNSPNSQDIWVRVKSDLGNNCLGLEEFPNLLIVEALPTANPVTISRQCDYDTTDTVLSFPFNTSQLESNVLNGQNPTNVSITYFDASGSTLLYSDGTPVTSPIQPVFLTENQTITIRVTNNSTLDPDGACYDETNLEFIIDEQPIIANTVPNQIFCDDGNDGTDENDGLHSFDTSSFVNTILGTQSNMEIYFDYFDENGVLVTNSPSLPNPLISGNQTISIEVLNPINPICTATTTIQFIVNPIPEFTIDEEEIVCTSDPTFSVILEPFLVNTSETFDYEWSSQTGNILSNATTLEVSTPGDYTITLTNPVTNCSKSKIVSVKSSELANIGLSDIEVQDFSENNVVTILNPSSLGSGNYEFSLESKDGKITYPFQDSPVFNNVRAGLYDLLVKDYICGTVSLEISVIGYVKFFTPNGDGNNDTWNIKGISSNFQANSNIYIFDRYGKLIKELNPLEQGWNGTFNGSLMPSDDYWFKVLLEDGRVFMGHFSLKR